MTETDGYDLQNQLLDLVMKMHGIESDYGLAKHLGVPVQTIRNYRKNKSFMDDTMCLQVAQELKMEPLQVMARVRCASAKTERIKRVWSSHLGRLLLVFCLASPLTGQIAEASQGFAQNRGESSLSNIHYTQLRGSDG